MLVQCSTPSLTQASASVPVPLRLAVPVAARVVAPSPFQSDHLAHLPIMINRPSVAATDSLALALAVPVPRRHAMLESSLG